MGQVVIVKSIQSDSSNQLIEQLFKSVAQSACGEWYLFVREPCLDILECFLVLKRELAVYFNKRQIHLAIFQQKPFVTLVYLDNDPI